MKILETDRLILRTFSVDDAAFILRLVNEPSWLEFIGDHEVPDLVEAHHYILNGPLTMFDEYGFSLCVTELKTGAAPIGVCGLVKRESLPDPDLGFALLPEFCGQGYALEAASAILEFGRGQLGIDRVLAITLPENQRSIKLLTSLGFALVGPFRLGEIEPEVNLFAHEPVHP